ncbi:MAG TPA: DNA-3-methyladenine glycosylase [Verrucomicrobiae bacterium]|jgi:DNA-3-methyladenine glycosylase II
MTISHSEHVESALAHLRDADPVMRRLIERAGPFSLKLRRQRFLMLVYSIISQQISTSAARSIRKRLHEHLAPGRITPDHLARETVASLRKAGLSKQKAAYLLDLSRMVRAGEVRLARIHRLEDEQVIEELIQVNGIGVWTAQMFLMFSLGRPDVFPHGDLGIRSALRNLYRLDELPDRDTAHEIARPWRPYATIASWYCWRSLELPKENAMGGQLA